MVKDLISAHDTLVEHRIILKLISRQKWILWADSSGWFTLSGKLYEVTRLDLKKTESLLALWARHLEQLVKLT